MRGSFARHIFRQGRFADSRFATQKNETAVSTNRGSQLVSQEKLLPRAPDQQWDAGRRKTG